MALEQKLSVRMSQRLIMTPSLQQAIKLLQMSSHELQTFVEAELERNPLLERDESSDNTPAKTENNEAASDGPVEDIASTLGDDSATAEKLDTMDTDLANVYADEARADTEARVAGAVTDSNWSSLRSSGGGGDGQVLRVTPVPLKP